MNYINIEKKLLRKTFKFTSYTWKSGLLDLLSIFLFLIVFLFIVGQINYQAYQTQIFEQNYAALLEEENIQNDFRSTLLDNYSEVLNSLIAFILISLIIIVLLSFIIGTFIKILQYRMLNTHIYKDSKQYFKLVWKTLVNTFPLFFAFWIIMFLLPIIFGFTIIIVILMIILFLFYLYALPILRMCSVRHNSFKKTWKALFNLLKPKNAIYFSTVTKLLVLIVLIVSIILVFINGSLNTGFAQTILSIIHILFLVLSLVFLRKFLFVSTAYIELLKKK